MKEFGDWLRAVRTRADLSQIDLAEACRRLDPKPGVRVFQGRITDWELGKRLPTLRQLVVLCRALGLSDNEIRAGRDLWDSAQLQDLPIDHVASEEPAELEEELTLHDFPTPVP